MRAAVVREGAASSRFESAPGELAARYGGVLPPARAAAYAKRVLDGREDWTKNFDGAQFTLGRAWYTHLEVDREDDYFDRVTASDATVERWAPGLQAALIDGASRILGAPVVRRRRWCGPGVHVFLHGREVAKKGGVLHFDTEGLDDAQVARRAPALSFVLMLQPPESGGGLRLWDRLYDGEDFPEDPGPRAPTALVRYEAGDLVVFDSYRMHQIQPFGGDLDRISATMHVAEEEGVWQAWF